MEEVPRDENSRVDDWIPQMGMDFNSENDAHKFYVTYGGRTGFNVRRGPAHKSKKDPNILTSRIFLCSKAGIREDDKENEYRKYSQPVTRVKCGALMGIKLTTTAAHEMSLVAESGIGAKATFEYLGIQAGGKENVGFTEVDIYNHLQTKRQRDLMYGEAASLLNYFEDKSKDNPSYYSSY